MAKKTLFIAIVSLQVLFLVFLIVNRQLAVAGGRKILLETEPVDPTDLFRGKFITLNYQFSRFTVTTPDTVTIDRPVYTLLEQTNGLYRLKEIGLKRPAKATSHSVILNGRVNDVDFFRQIFILSNLNAVGGIFPGTAAPSSNLTLAVPVHGTPMVNGQRLYIAVLNESFFINPVHYNNYLYNTSISLLSNNVTYFNKYRIHYFSAFVSDLKNEYALQVKYGIESYFTPEGSASSLERLAGITNRSGSKRLIVEASVSKQGDAVISRLLLDGKEIYFLKNGITNRN